MNNVDRLVQAVRQNPEGLLLLGAGVALMLRSSMGPSSPDRKRSAAQAAARSGAQNAKQPRASEAVEPSLAQSLRDGVSGVQDAVASAAQGLGERASELGQAAADGAKRAADGAQSSMNDVVEAQPIAVAIAGVAVGCLAAAFLPTSRLENDTLRPFGKQAVGALSGARERVKDATIRAGEQLKDTVLEKVLERGLNREGITEAVREVASDFKSNVMGSTEASPAVPKGTSYGR